MKFVLAVCGMSVLFLAGCSKQPAPVQASAQTMQTVEPITVKVAAAETRKIGRAISVTGSLAPDETVSVSSEVAGRIAAIRYDFGQPVRKGEIIAELDKREFDLQVQRSRAALAQALARIGLDPKQEEARPDSTPAIRQAEAQFEDARFKYENAARLIKTGDISQERFTELEKAYTGRKAALEAARDELRTQLANVQALRADVALSEKRLSDTTLRAPFDGAISARLASPGQYMRENTPIVTLVKTHPLRLRAEIPESAASEARAGMTLTFTTDAAPGKEFHAAVRQLNPTLESRSRTLTVEARLTGSDPVLRPGMFVQVRLAVARDATAVVVPKEALYQMAGLNKIFAIRGGKAEEIKVAPGADMQGWIEVPGDRLRPGEQVAVTKVAMLVNGAPVKTDAAAR